MNMTNSTHIMPKFSNFFTAVAYPDMDNSSLLICAKARGIEVEYMVKENEGHGFGNEENRFDFYRAMESFLGQHLLNK